jgi:hypothetical protein
MAEFVTAKEAQRRLAAVIVCIALSVIALVVGVISYKSVSDQNKQETANSVAKLRKEISERRTSNQQMREAYRDYTKNIGWRALSVGSHEPAALAGFAPPDRLSGLSGPRLQEYLDNWVREQFPRLEIKGYRTSDQTGAGDPLTLAKLFDELEKKEKDLDSKIKAAQAARDTDDSAGTATAQATAKEDDANLQMIDQAGTGLKDRVKGALVQLKNNETKYQLELDGDGTPANRGLAGQVYDLEAQLTELRNYNLNLKVQLTAQRRELETRLNWLVYRQEEARERKEPDGEILSIDVAQGIAFIDLIHQDRIFRGGRFKVYSLEKGGEKRDKGEIEILEVGRENYSKVAVYNTKPEDPVAAGDKIYNETYERGKTRNIAFAGRLTGKLSNEDAIRRIKEFGDVYQERVNEKTNYLIVGEGYENDPNFKLAQEYGVKVMIEKIFHEYLGIPQ